VNALFRGLLISAIVIAGITSLPLDAQDSTSSAAFEVASIKTRTGDRVVGGTTTPDRFARADATLRDLIRYAFDLQDFQIEGGPEWVASSRFEVNAKAAGAPSGPDGMRALVRRLLEDRFALKTHTEPRELPLFELVVARRDGKLGERLRPSTLQCETVSTDPRCRTRFNAKMMNTTGNQPPGIYSMTLILEGTTMARLAALLQNEVRRVIVDKTGLTGTFDLELEFAPQGPRPIGLPPGPAPPPSDGPPLATAIQEQLGLKLESVRGPVPVLVIDNARLPTPD
jgi:uncharacterized protein (TIGR03435 family)